MSNIGQKIKNARKEMKLKQSEMADLIGVSNTTVSGWENGASRPDVDMIENLCRILSVSPNYFFDTRALGLDEPTEPELEMIKKYRALDLRGKNTVLETLNREYSYVSIEQNLGDNDVEYSDEFITYRLVARNNGKNVHEMKGKKVDPLTIEGLKGDKF